MGEGLAGSLVDGHSVCLSRTGSIVGESRGRAVRRDYQSTRVVVV